MTARVAVLVMIMAGAATAGLPFVAWYAVDTPRGVVTATGVEAASELWTLVVLGGAIAFLGFLAARGPCTIAQVVFVAGAAAICVAWAVENALNVPVGLLVVEPGGSAGRVADDLVEVRVQPSAYLAASAAALSGMAVMLRRLEDVA